MDSSTKFALDILGDGINLLKIRFLTVIRP